MFSVSFFISTPKIPFCCPSPGLGLFSVTPTSTQQGPCSCPIFCPWLRVSALFSLTHCLASSFILLKPCRTSLCSMGQGALAHLLKLQMSTLVLSLCGPQLWDELLTEKYGVSPLF